MFGGLSAFPGPVGEYKQELQEWNCFRFRLRVQVQCLHRRYRPASTHSTMRRSDVVSSIFRARQNNKRSMPGTVAEARVKLLNSQ
jgi:hypothetical protein